MRIEDIKVGMKVKYATEPAIYTVTAVGNDRVLVVGSSFATEYASNASSLVEVVGYPELWLNVFRSSCGGVDTFTHTTELRGNTPWNVAKRICCLHLKSDGTVELLKP